LIDNARYYFQNGQLDSDLNYTDDLLEGEQKWYHENGKLNLHAFYVRGREYGSLTSYNDQGGLQHYNCIDFYNGTVYVLKFDSLGNKIKEEGVVFSPNIKSEPKDTSQWKVNIPMQFEITVAEPPGYKANLWTRYMLAGKVTNRKLHSIENSTAVEKNSFSQPGKYNLIIIGELRDKSGAMIRRDSVVRYFTIIDDK
jgi:hypothetical protein